MFFKLCHLWHNVFSRQQVLIVALGFLEAIMCKLYQSRMKNKQRQKPNARSRNDQEEAKRPFVSTYAPKVVTRHSGSCKQSPPTQTLQESLDVEAPTKPEYLV